MSLPAPDEATGLASVLLLAVVQGIAEFLPISSSGHLALGRIALGLEEAGLALDIALHAGTLLAVLWAYRRDVGRLIGEVLEGNIHMLLWLIVATIPVAVIGVLFKDSVESMGTNPRYVGLFLLCTSIFLVLGERSRPHVDEDPHAGYGKPRFSDAIVMGLAQTTALLPGISRSGSTIAAAFMRGIPSHQAARLSFLMSLLAVGGATLLQAKEVLEQGFEATFGGFGAGSVLLAIGVSALVGWAALATLLLVLSKGALRWFAGYCALLAAVALFAF